MADKNNGKIRLTNPTISEIYGSHKQPLKSFIDRRVPSKEDAEDILQNVFYQLSRIDLEANPIEHISSWLYSVARNQIIDRSRKHKEEQLSYTRNEEGEESFTKELTNAILASDSPETEYLKSLIWEELEDALDELPKEQRSIFELSEFEGFSFKEISEASGIPINTLISRKRYAVLHLRERLQELYKELLYD